MLKLNGKPGSTWSSGLLILTYTWLYLLAITPLLAEESDQYPSSEPIKIKVWPREKEDTESRWRQYLSGQSVDMRHCCKETNG